MRWPKRRGPPFYARRRRCGASDRAHRGMTLGGFRAARSAHRSERPKVFDVVGAGDTVIATLSLALGASLNMEEGGAAG